MTDTHAGYTIILEKDLNEYDSQKIIEAISMIKGVLEVTPITTNVLDQISHRRAKSELMGKLFEVLK